MGDKTAKAVTGPVTFMCRWQHHIITMQRTWVEVQAGIPITHPGRRIVFRNGSYTTSDPKEIAFLRNYPGYGAEIWEANSQAKAAMGEPEKAEDTSGQEVKVS